MSLFQWVGPDHHLQIAGVRLVGWSAGTGKKLLLTLALVAVVLLLRRLALAASFAILREKNERARFWARQIASLATLLILVLGLASIWFDNPGRLTAAAGLVTAALVFALQRFVTAIAGYFVILRGNTFHVGDRIMMGGVRGDVIKLGLTQTVIMEMGQAPGEQGDTPSMWVQARQYTGRMVTVSNAVIFDQPVYNYTREFPFLWEEMRVPVRVDPQRGAAERILLDAAERHTVKIKALGERDLRELERRYAVRSADMGPRVYWRITDNWLELTVRFLTRDHEIRDVKDAMSRDILEAFDRHGISVASATSEIVGLPPLEVHWRAEEGDGRRSGTER